MTTTVVLPTDAADLAREHADLAGISIDLWVELAVRAYTPPPGEPGYEFDDMGFPSPPRNGNT